MKATILATVSIEVEIDEDMKSEIREALDLEDDKGPTPLDIRDYFADQAQDDLENIMSNYGFSVDDVKVKVNGETVKD